MSRKRFPTLALGLAAILLPLGAGVAPAASAATATPRAAHTLALTSNPGESPTRDARTSVLNCLPPGGTHPQAAWSCYELRKAGGDPAKVNLDLGDPCYLIWAPVTVTARGVWEGRRIDYQETFPNDCVLHTVKGPLFRF